jgi:3-hydroxybutyryl-CoA dehydratase
MTPQPGDTLPPFVIDSVSAAAMKEWAVFLADPNPIHLDPAVVKAKGLGDRVINQGPANVAYLINMLMQAFPRGTIASMESRFVDNVYAEDQLTAGGSVTAVKDGVVSCDIWLRADSRDAVITGTARVKLQA